MEPWGLDYNAYPQELGYGAALKPYQPTWRDKLAAALAGNTRNTARQNFTEGLLGSRGMGTTGMGLVDFTPAGIGLAGNEAQMAARQGNATGALLNAMALIPAAKPGAAIAKAAVKGGQAAANTAGDVVPGIKAYHGSPHDFDKFDISKIGTGEGAQAYGHGLYFADNEAVARTYKDAAKGRMYEVNIRANPDDFLDWDKPLSEQPGAVQAALLKRVPPAGMNPIFDDDLLAAPKKNGGFEYKANIGKFIQKVQGSNAVGLSADLKAAGIPGIKYLDQGSRTAGEGSRNYVVFDDKIVDILRKYGIAGLALAGALGAPLMNKQPQTAPGG